MLQTLHFVALTFGHTEFQFHTKQNTIDHHHVVSISSQYNHRWPTLLIKRTTKTTRRHHKKSTKKPFSFGMGAPKQKWTAEEEAALKAGVQKYGSGKWLTILKDPEFSGILYLRSIVDLKDKWRNLSVMVTGMGSREKSNVAFKKGQSTPKQDENRGASELPETDEEIDVKPLPISSSSQTLQIPDSRGSTFRLGNLILEAITELREHGVSNETAIASYIEDQYWAPPDFKRLLSAKLKFLVSNGELIKVEGRYRIPPVALSSNKQKKNLMITYATRQLTTPKMERAPVPILTRSQIGLDLEKMRNMTAQEAGAAAARAVAEAEKAIAEAEEAAREAEADAETAQEFAKAAMKTLGGRSIQKMVKGHHGIPTLPLSSDKQKQNPMITQETQQLTTPKMERAPVPILPRTQMDLELEKMRNMTAQEAAAAAARAVAEAELAIEEAETAEADAEAAEEFAKAAMKTLGGRSWSVANDRLMEPCGASVVNIVCKC
ncbi:Telomere repeat-binding factor 1-like protein [Drosera capensis]